jgi:SAM-dependent methyltransferase
MIITTGGEPNKLVVMSIFVLILGLILVTSVTWTSFVGAPWVPTSMSMVHKMLKLADVGPADIVYDLGCGDGRTVITAARYYGARAVGVEIDPLRYLWCQLRVTFLGLRDRVKIVYGNFFAQDLSAATVVTCYLLQDTNNKLEKKFEQELSSGTRVVSNTFYFRRLQTVRRDDEATLYVLYLDRNK